MEDNNEVQLADGEDPKESLSDTSSCKESVGDSGSPKSNDLPPWLERFEGKTTVPAGLVWCTCDLTVEECCTDICNILMENSRKEKEDNKAVIIFTPSFLRWSCCPPGYLPGLHIGIWDSFLGKLVAFLAAIPTRVRAMEETSRIAWIRSSVVHNDFRDRIPWKIIRKELFRRIRSENIRWFVLKKQTSGPAPMAFPAWERVLNSRTLFDLGYIKSTVMTPGEIVEYFQLPLSPDVRGFKVMNASHVEPLASLLNTCFRTFKVARKFDEEEVKHFFLPSANLVRSYVYVEPDETITGFCSFVILRESWKGVEFTSAFSFYNFTIGMPLQQLLRDAMVLALENNCDLFIAYDIMGIGDFLVELRFHHMRMYFQYDFYLDGIGDLTKDDIGLVLL